MKVTAILNNTAGELGRVEFEPSADHGFEFSLQDVADAVERDGCWLLSDGDAIRIYVTP